MLYKKSGPPDRRDGGAKGIRTLDLYNASVALFRLSYRPL